MRRANCIIFALALWLRRTLRASRASSDQVVSESYIVFRLSRIRFGLFHILHGKLDKTTNQLKLVSYKPNVPEKTRPAPLFAGHVVRGDRAAKIDQQ